MSEEAKGTDTIRDGYGDDTTTGQVLPQSSTIVLSHEATAMDIHDHGQGLVDRLGGGDDTEVETVLAHHVETHVATFGLWGPFGTLLGLQNALPGLGGLWCLPAQIAHRRRSERNGLVNREVRTIEHTL